MSLLQDKHFEDLDFISQAVEPFFHPVLDLFKTLPSEIYISTKELQVIVDNRYNDSKCIDNYKLDSLIRQIIEKLPGASDFYGICSKFYDAKVNGLCYDVYSDVLQGDITLVKKAECPLSQEAIGEEIKNTIYDAFRGYASVEASRKEVLDLSYLFLGAEVTNAIIDEKLKPKQMWYEIVNKVSILFFSGDPKYRIRGLDAATKLRKNIINYVECRNPERAMANLTLFKMVMDKGNAVYSLQEISDEVR